MKIRYAFLLAFLFLVPRLCNAQSGFTKVSCPNFVQDVQFFNDSEAIAFGDSLVSAKRDLNYRSTDGGVNWPDIEIESHPTEEYPAYFLNQATRNFLSLGGESGIIITNSYFETLVGAGVVYTPDRGIHTYTIPGPSYPISFPCQFQRVQSAQMLLASSPPVGATDSIKLFVISSAYNIQLTTPSIQSNRFDSIVAVQFFDDSTAIIIVQDTARVRYAFNTKDGGGTWARYRKLPEDSTGGSKCICLARSSQNAMVAATTVGLLISEDRGSSWRPVIAVGNSLVTALLIQGQYGVCTFLNSDHCYLSSDSGHSWFASRSDAILDGDVHIKFFGKDAAMVFAHPSQTLALRGPSPSTLLVDRHLLAPPQPVLHFENRTLDLGKIDSGLTSQRQIMAYNIGTDTLKYHAAPSTAFVQIAPSSATIPAGDSLLLTLTLRPHHGKPNIWDSIIFIDNSTESDNFLTVSGYTDAPELAAATRGFSGYIEKGDTIVLPISLYNAGSKSVMITSVDASPFRVVADTSIPALLRPNDSRTLLLGVINEFPAADSIRIHFKTNALEPDTYITTAIRGASDSVLTQWVLPFDHAANAIATDTAVYVLKENGTLISFYTSGVKRWERDLKIKASLDSRTLGLGKAGMVVAAGLLSDSIESTIALSPSGNVLWGDSIKNVDGSSPLLSVSDGLIAVGANSGSFTRSSQYTDVGEAILRLIDSKALSPVTLEYNGSGFYGQRSGYLGKDRCTDLAVSPEGRIAFRALLDDTHSNSELGQPWVFSPRIDELFGTPPKNISQSTTWYDFGHAMGFFGSEQLILQSLDGISGQDSTGKRIWFYPQYTTIDAGGSPSGAVRFVDHGSDSLYALDAHGTMQWTLPLPAEGSDTRVIVDRLSNSYVSYYLRNPYMSATISLVKIDSIGKPRWALTFAADPASHNCDVSIAADGTVYILQTATNGKGTLRKIAQPGYPTKAVPRVEYRGKEMQLHPNPAASFVTITMKDPNVSFVQIIDVLGRVVMESHSVRGHDLRFDVSHQPSGVYLAKRISADGSLSTARFTVEH